MKVLLKKKTPFSVIPVLWLMLVFFLSSNVSAWGQTSTVVIAEVLYDSPLTGTVFTVHEGEFLSLYNYEEEEVNIGGWRVEVTDLMASPQSACSYTLPANTLLPAFCVAVIASRPVNSTFDVGKFYGREDPDSSGNVLHYNQSLVFPDTRSRIRIYDAQNRLQDELTYDGTTAALPNEPLLRAENGYSPDRPGEEAVSIQREQIRVTGGQHAISRTDYFLSDSGQTVQLFDFLPAEMSFSFDPSSGPEHALSPSNLNLSGTVTGNNDYRASVITSTQVVENGKTVYLAEEEIVLDYGFEVKADADFEAMIERDSLHHLTILTYNLWGSKTDYADHAEVVKASKAGVVALQEVKRIINFRELREKSGYSGEMCVTKLRGIPLGPDGEGVGLKYGIGLLWNLSLVGNPIEIAEIIMETNKGEDVDKKRAYIIAEFNDFCFVSTHYSLDQSYRIEMTESILGNNITQRCKNSGKPIYIAGDMNEGPDGNAVGMFIDNGFEVLNDTTTRNGRYNHATREDGSMIDLILGYNTNEYHKIIERGIHLAPYPAHLWESGAGKEQISDHKPYRIKVKIR